MSKQKINIERLQIRVKGVSPQVARAAADELGFELLGRLSAPGALNANARHVRARELNAGTVHLSGATNAADLRRRIAQDVVASISSKLKPRE